MVVFVGGIYYGGDTDDTITGTDGGDSLQGGGGADVISGGAGADYLVGEDGADIIDGGTGDDIIMGGRTAISFDYDHGADKLTGGAGADTFRFEFGYTDYPGNLGEIDHIVDFSGAEGDRLTLFPRPYGMRMAWAGAIADPTFSLDIGKTLGGDAPEGYATLFTWSNATTSYLIVDVDGDHKLSAKDFVIAFDNKATIGVSDITQLGDLQQFGGAGADSWTGFAGDDIYDGRAGADRIDGGGGADKLYGGSGDDVIDGGSGDDFVLGNDGADTVHGGDGADLLYAGANVNSFGDEGSGVNQLFGDAGNDTLIGASAVDILDGGAGNDLLNGGQDLGQNSAPGDILRGGEGDDFLLASGVASMDGGAGADRLAIGGGALTITGGTGADAFLLTGYTRLSASWTAIGYATITDFNAAEGDKIVLGGRTTYPAVLRGGVDAGFSLTEGATFSARDYGPGFAQFWTWSNGSDTYLFVDNDGDGKLSAQDNVLKFNGVITLSQAQFAIDPQLENFKFNDLGGTEGADVFNGTDAVETYYGLNGDDVIHGGGGYYDYLYGNNGADKIYGDAGQDWIYGGPGDDYIDGGDDGDMIWGGAGADVIHGGAGDDSIQTSGTLRGDTDVEGTLNLAYGEAGDDSITGSGRLYGGDGNDHVYGSGELYGDAGADYVTAGGYAIVHGGDGDDFVAGGSAGSVLYGDAGKDSFQGGYGDDVMYVELGDRSVFGGDGNDTVNLSNARAGESVVLTTVQGGGGNDVFAIREVLASALVLNGGDGADTLDLRLADGAVTVDLSKTQVQNTGFGQFTLDSVENVQAGDRGATLTGNDVANALSGGGARDVLNGGKGADVLSGGGGDDALDGGEGLDTAVYSGPASAYSWARAADGSWAVKDLRSGGDGQDRLISVETLKFSDKTVSLTQVAVETILRGGAAMITADLEYRISVGTQTLEGAIAAIVNTADSTTSVASMSYQFFTGKAPSQGGVDYLISPIGPNPANLNSAYYAQFNTVNRYINFAVNLGKNGEAKDSFAAGYGSLSLFDATKKAYAAIFGGTPTDAKVNALMDGRVDYLAYYGGDGTTGIGTKAAMVGFLLAAAATENLGVIAKSNDAWLTDLADGSGPFAVNLLDPANGYYKTDFIFGG